MSALEIKTGEMKNLNWDNSIGDKKEVYNWEMLKDSINSALYLSGEKL